MTRTELPLTKRLTYQNIRDRQFSQPKRIFWIRLRCILKRTGLPRFGERRHGEVV